MLEKLQFLSDDMNIIRPSIHAKSFFSEFRFPWPKVWSTYLESPEATNRFLPTTHDWKKLGTCLCLIVLVLSWRIDFYATWLTCDLTEYWSQVKCWPNRSMSSCICCDAPWREEYDDARNRSLALLVQMLLAKNVKMGYFALCWHLTSKPLMLYQFWNGSKRAAQGLSSFPGVISIIVSEIMAHFRRNRYGILLNFTSDDICWHRYSP